MNKAQRVLAVTCLLQEAEHLNQQFEMLKRDLDRAERVVETVRADIKDTESKILAYQEAAEELREQND